MITLVWSFCLVVVGIFLNSILEQLNISSFSKACKIWSMLDQRVRSVCKIL